MFEHENYCTNVWVTQGSLKKCECAVLPERAEATSGKNRIASSASGCTRRTRRFGRNLAQLDAARQGTARSDAVCQHTLRPDEECHGVYLADEECQGIFLPDAAVSSRYSLVIWTQL
jgi:hypothetical protein